MMDNQGDYLHAANLGDSGYLLLRKNGYDLITVHRTKEQQHGFNFPFQCGVGGDDPVLANLLVHEVKHNDILIVGSDGLFDNMFDNQITEIVTPFIKNSDDLLDPELVAQMIAKQAETLSLNTRWMSPFAKHAYDNFYDFKGGKHDDVTVVVSQIKISDIE
jgi:protein phosphatase PTC7